MHGLQTVDCVSAFLWVGHTSPLSHFSLQNLSTKIIWKTLKSLGQGTVYMIRRNYKRIRYGELACLQVVYSPTLPGPNVFQNSVCTPGMIVCAFDSSIQEVEAQEKVVSLRPTWAPQQDSILRNQDTQKSAFRKIIQLIQCMLVSRNQLFLQQNE